MVCKVTPKNNGVQCRDETMEHESVADYETALDLAGYGRFSRSVLGACACSFFTTGVQNCLMSYVLPAARCELMLTTYQAGLVNMAFMCGGVASAFFWGIIADVFGRRRVLSLTLLIDGCLTLAQSTVNDYRLLVLARCINGFLIGGPSTLIFSYLSDLVGVRKRQLYLNVTGMSFVVAWLILPALAWLILPYKPSQYSPTLLPIYSWRLFLAVSSIPGFVSGIWVLFLPESPRLLADTNRSEKALKILTKIFESNVRQNNSDFKIKTLKMSDKITTKAESSKENRTKDLFMGVLKDLKIFVSRLYAWKSTLILFVFFANMAAGFGLNLWIPELLLRMQGRGCKYSVNLIPEKHVKILQDHNTTHFRDDYKIHQKQLDFIEQNNRSLYDGAFGKRDENATCNETMNDEVFTSGLIVGACCVLGNAACAVLSARGGAKGVRLAAAGCALACALACACLATFACSCTNSNKLAVAAAAALNAASLNGNVLLIRLLLHAVPAKLSGLAVCWGAWWGRAGGVASNLAVGALLDLSCPAPFASVAVLLIISVGAIIMVKLENPDSKQNTEDNIEENLEEKHDNMDKYTTTHI